MKWCIDLDGVITSNPNFFKWWTYQLKKKGNDNEIHILTARNPSRYHETIFEIMEKFKIDFAKVQEIKGYFKGLMRL